MNSKFFGNFYNPNKALSYGKAWILSVGSRSIGKSTGWMIEAIYHYIKTGKKFIYLRRTRDEVEITAPKACSNAVEILKNNGIEIDRILAKGGQYTLYRTGEAEDKGEICGYYTGLSITPKYKSNNFSDCDRIIYDEFIADDDTMYLGSQRNPMKEAHLCHAFYRTVDRGLNQAYRNETRFIFIGNVASYYCPIFLDLGIDKYLTPETKYLAPKGKNWVLEQTTGVTATQDIDKSWASQLENESERAYNDKGRALLDGSDTYIAKIKEPRKPLFCVNFRGVLMTVNIVESLQIIYITSGGCNLKPIALTVGDQGGIDYTIARRPAEFMPLQRVFDAMKAGRVFYENKRVKMLIGTYMNFLPVAMT